MTTSDPTPGDHDELIAALRRKAKFFERPEGGANETFLLLNRAAAALGTEQSARQAAEARASTLNDNWLTKWDAVCAERDALQQRIDAVRRALGSLNRLEEYGARPLRHRLRNVHATLTAESKEPDPKLDSISSALSKATGLPPERIHNDRHPLDMD